MALTFDYQLGGVNVNAANPNIDVTDTGTSHASQDFLTNSNSIRATIGVERSTGGGLFVGSSAYAAVFGTASNGVTQFATNNNVRMTLDTSGNVMVGTTTYNGPANATTGDYGAALWNSGLIAAGTNASEVLVLNRMNSDGDIAVFKRSGTTVGSIGVESSDNLTIGATTANHSGLLFGTNAVIPMQAGSGSDATQDLGNSGSRFKDLYLSGGVYGGGTAAANKFDDLESGTWTPQDNSGNNWTQTSTAKYYKIGDLVTCWFDISHNAGIGSNANRLGNFPFTSDSGSNYAGTQGYTTSNSAITFHLGSNTKLATFYVANVSTQMTGRLIGSITYRTA